MSPQEHDVIPITLFKASCAQFNMPVFIFGYLQLAKDAVMALSVPA